jgi:hypothetical protein
MCTDAETIKRRNSKFLSLRRRLVLKAGEGGEVRFRRWQRRDGEEESSLRTLQTFDALALAISLFGELGRSLDAFTTLVALFHDSTGPKHERRYRLLFLLPRNVHQSPVLCLQLYHILYQSQNYPILKYFISTAFDIAP